jgi:hypothetical protein
MINYIHIFFLSKGPSYIDVGVLNEKISQVNVTTKNLIFKLHLLLNTICCTRPLNPRQSAMMKIIFIIFTLLLISCGSNRNNEQLDRNTNDDYSKLPDYTIINEDYSPSFNICNVDVKLLSEVDTSTLKLLAYDIKKDREDCSFLLIFYYTSGSNNRNFAWATTHFEPGLRVNIISSTKIPDNDISNAIDMVDGKILGAWGKDDPLLGDLVLVFYSNEKGLFQSLIKGKSQTVYPLIESKKDDKLQYNAVHNDEYYIIEDNGNLSLFDHEGKFYEAEKLTQFDIK